MDKVKKNLEESIRHRLKNLSQSKGRRFDETLRYYGMERFLYRLSVSPYANKFFLKGGLLLRVWNALAHRATMDIDLLAKTANTPENIKNIIKEVSIIPCIEDGVIFDISNLIIRETQTGGEYNGVNCSFSANLLTTRIPILIDIGFNDIVVPEPKEIQYPTILDMAKPILLGYPVETAFAEKLESMVKLGTTNTRMKDFFDLWFMIQIHELELNKLRWAIEKVFQNRRTPLKFPSSFQPEFYENSETQIRWKNFLSTIGQEGISLESVILKLSSYWKTIFPDDL